MYIVNSQHATLTCGIPLQKQPRICENECARSSMQKTRCPSSNRTGSSSGTEIGPGGLMSLACARWRRGKRVKDTLRKVEFEACEQQRGECTDDVCVCDHSLLLRCACYGHGTVLWWLVLGSSFFFLVGVIVRFFGSLVLELCTYDIPRMSILHNLEEHNRKAALMITLSRSVLISRRIALL